MFLCQVKQLHMYAYLLYAHETYEVALTNLHCLLAYVNYLHYTDQYHFYRCWLNTRSASLFTQVYTV